MSASEQVRGAAADAWRPAQYERFRDERARPFEDLFAMIEAKPAMRVLDLGSGTGELTVRLAERLDAREATGVDLSKAMHAQAEKRATDRVRFREGDIGALGAAELGACDLLFSHAALQWVPESEQVLVRCFDALAPGAQLAVQVPKNGAHPSHTIAHELAREAPFAEFLEGRGQPGFATAERIAELLWARGARALEVREVLYLHELASTAEVVEWTKGTLLNGYLPHLPPELRARYLETYRSRVLGALGERAPYLYPFRRMLVWAKK